MQEDDETINSLNGFATQRRAGKGLKAGIQGPGRLHRGSGICADREPADPMSSIHGVSCVCAGDIHSGRMDVIGSGRHSRVSVLYKGNELQAESGGLSPIAVAKWLLERLVLYEAIANVVEAGEKRTRNKDPSRVS